MAQAGDLQIFMGVEDQLMVINLPMTELLTDDMDEIIGRHMDIHILDGKGILDEGIDVAMLVPIESDIPSHY